MRHPAFLRNRERAQERRLQTAAVIVKAAGPTSGLPACKLLNQPVTPVQTPRTARVLALNHIGPAACNSGTSVL